MRQRELELEQQRLKATPDPTNESEGEEEEGEEEKESRASAKPSLFALLGGNDADDNHQDGSEDEEVQDPPADSKLVTPAKSKKKNKKKKKKKAKGQEDAAVEVEEEDEIDRALRQLSLNAPAGDAPVVASSTNPDIELSDLFKIDSRKFDAAHEMRKLFGREAVSAEDEDRAAGAGRGGRGGRARMIAHQQRLQSARRNIFIQPNPEWPPYSGVGLGMEVVKDEDSMTDAAAGVTEFRFVHSHNYQDTQRQFMICVQSMGTASLLLILLP
jgi:hypothetical protein